MASLQKKTDNWYCQFYFKNKRFTFSVGNVAEIEARAVAAKVDYLLMRLKQRLLDLPAGCDIVTFVRHDGNPPESAFRETKEKDATFGEIRDSYFRTHSNGTLEQSTLDGFQLDLKQWKKTLGEHYPLDALCLADLQRHVDRRAKMKGSRGKISAATLKKEVVTLRTVWNWAERFGYVSGKFPNRGLRYPKTDEKMPFMTWNEIERQIASGGQPNELWECLYLTLQEIDELLEFVKANATLPWVYPVVSLAAHTGARRSEILRVETRDVDFDGGMITIREKKRTRGQRTTRRVPLSTTLGQVLEDWMTIRPNGEKLFCQETKVIRSKTKRIHPTPLSRNEAHDHFKRTLSHSKWSVLKGYHILRHSFISACASRGIDQRLIDEWVGHTTEEMRRRYRHLYPTSQQEPLRSVFG